MFQIRVIQPGSLFIRLLNNQESLIIALANRRTGLKDVLLDGHFCLFDQSSVIQRIPREGETKRFRAAASASKSSYGCTC
jgi:hypothetical protein